MDATHTALEHLSGVVLYTESPSPPDSPTSAFNGGPATEQGWFLEGTGPQREEHCSHAARQRAPHSALHASPFAAANFAGCFV